MIAYKGFNRDMTCRGFQYEEGKEYTMEGEIEICKNGFHSCEFPLDCFSYYAPVYSAEYHEVEIPDDSIVDNTGKIQDTKIASNKIKVGKKLSLLEMIVASISYIIKKDRKPAIVLKIEEVSSEYLQTVTVNNEPNSLASCINGYKSVAVNTSDSSVACIDGSFRCAAITIGNNSASLAHRPNSISGSCGIESISYSGSKSISGVVMERSTAITQYSKSVAASTEEYDLSKTCSTASVAACTGYRSKAIVEGDTSISANVGDDSISIAGGITSAAICNGLRSIAVANTKDSMAISLGVNGVVRGVKGSYLVLGDYDVQIIDGIRVTNYKSPKMRKVDGSHIKADTWYTMKNGKFVEVTVTEFNMLHFYMN